MPGSAPSTPPSARVSVVLPFLNEAAYLANAVASVRAQSVDDWELLLVDDGSTDASHAMATEMASADQRIRVVRHPNGENRGLVASRNLGIEHARGDAIAFLDADDEWLPTKLAIQRDILERDPEVAMSCGAVWYRSADGSQRDLLKRLDTRSRRFERGELCRALLRRTVEPPPPSNVMFRTTALRQAGGVPAGDDLFEDQRTFFAINLTHPIHFIDQPLSVYTVRRDSMFGSLAGRDEVKYHQRESFERWAIRWAGRHGRDRRRLALELQVRRTAARTRWRLRSRLTRVLPERRFPRLRRWARRVRRGRVRWGSFRRLTPIAGNWGFDRGQPVDRYFIERFIEQHRSVIRGRVLEVQDPEYTVKFGADIDRSDVLDIDHGNPQATVIADLQVAGSLPEGSYDCAIVTQTLQFMDDLVASLRNLWNCLAPGGSLLVTMPTVSKLEESLADVERWRVTPRGLEDALSRACPGATIAVRGYGNILVSTAFLYGLTTDELRRRELEYDDPIFPTGACGIATKPRGAS